MAENEAQTMAAPLPTSTAALPQTAPETYPASAPTTVQATSRPVVPVEPAQPSPWNRSPEPAQPVTQSVPAQPVTQSVPGQPVVGAGPAAHPASGWAVNAQPAVPAAAFPAAAETLDSDQKMLPRNDFLSRLRTPAVTAAAGGVLVLAVGFGAGFVVGRDHAGTGSSAGVQGGQGGFPGGGTGFGGGNGQGQQGFGGPQGQQGTNGQSQPGLNGQQDTDGTAQQGALDQFQ